MVRLIPAALAVAAVISSGVVHGLWTDRWSLSSEPAASVAKLDHVALTLGDWHGQVVEAEPGKQFGPAAGYLYRRYVHGRTGAGVTVFLVCGRPGPVSIHTPDVCYQASGHRMVAPGKYRLPAQGTQVAADFWTAQFHKTKAAEQTNLRIFWSWNAAGAWTVPDNPRWQFAGYPALFKLYLVREMAAANEPLEEDPCIDLMRHLLPELHQALFSAS